MKVFRRATPIALALAGLMLASVPGAAAPAEPAPLSSGSVEPTPLSFGGSVEPTPLSFGGSVEPTPLAKLEGDGFSIVVTDGSGKVGQETHVVVTIKAKDGYKVNEKYPHKLKVKDAPDGVELPKSVLKKADGSFDGKKAFTFKLPVKAKRAGTFELAGKLKFSVCNDKACLIEKKDVALKFTAK